MPSSPCPPPSPDAPDADADAAISPDDILVVRRGPGANCSSIGSALDILFLSAVAGGALLAGIAAAFPERGTPAAARPPPSDPPGSPPAAAEPEDPDARSA